jgi:hypothetical protein
MLTVARSSDRQYALAKTLFHIEHNRAVSESAIARDLLRMKKDVISIVNGTTPSNSSDLSEKLRVAQRIATLDLPRETMLSTLRYLEIENRQSNILGTTHSSYDWMFQSTVSNPPIQYFLWLCRGNEIF